MILFTPAYDEPTRANHAIATRLPAADVRLFEEEATRAALISALAAGDGPLFIMAHGESHRIKAQHGDTALHAADGAVLRRRPIYAFACHTASRLGPKLSQSGSVYWGYVREVTSPDMRAGVIAFFVEIFTHLARSFPAANSPDEVAGVIETTRQLCETALAEVDALAEADPKSDWIEAYQALRDIWQLLRVWRPGATVAERHARAPDLAPRDLF